MLLSIITIFFPLIITIVIIVLLFVQPKKRIILDNNIIYNDRYLEIYPSYIIISGFYFGPIGRKKIYFNSIKYIELIELDFWSGSYRIQGTGDFKAWFAHDINRPSKKKCFIIYRDGKWWRIGFGVENFDEVSAIFEAKGLFKATQNGQR